MINNFDLISKLLTFASDDEFYFVQILQRKKDNPDGQYGSNNSSRLIKAYYITSLKQLFDLKDEMINISKIFNARIGINLNKRSYYKTAFNTLKTIAEQMHNKEFKNVKRAWNTCCGIYNGGDKLWILDVDTEKISPLMLSFIDYHCKPELEVVFDEVGIPIFTKNDKIKALIPSKSGWHIITSPFDTREFNKKYPEIEIHRNNPTNLYIP